MAHTDEETANAFAMLADSWRSACGEELTRLRKAGANLEEVAYMRGMCDAYARIARIASETADAMRTGEACADPEAAKGAINESVRRLYRDLRDGKYRLDDEG